MAKLERAYKIRKSGNSDVTTIPQKVKDALGVKTGEAIEYVFLADGSVKIEKAKEAVDVDALVDSVMAQYEEALQDLVEL